MKQLNANEMIDYLDGTLSSERAAQVEAHLQTNAQDAAILADLKMAQGALSDLEAAEPIRVGADFWIKVRDSLPERAPRRGVLSSVRTWFSPSPLRLSLGVAAAVAFIMMLLSVFGPPQSTHSIEAKLPAASQLQRSIDEGRFESRPLSGAIPQRGVVGPQERRLDGSRDEENGDHTP